jgi:lysophospholipase L1-like esterase
MLCVPVKERGCARAVAAERVEHDALGLAIERGAEGPVDHPRLAEIIAAQRRVAEAADCAFYDQFAAMGGAGSIAAWAAEQPPRARKDGVHLSRDGYSELAGAFVGELERAYAAFRAERHEPATRPDDPVAHK